VTVPGYYQKTQVTTPIVYSSPTLHMVMTAAHRPRRLLAPHTLALHLDVDVLDFIDAPLAENTDCRNIGPTLDQVAEALTAAARDKRMRALSIGELNPTRCAGDPDALPRFVRSIARILAATTHRSSKLRRQ
jgi:arginase